MSSLGNKEVLAKNLAYYLARCGRDQREVADAVGVAPSTFNEWMRAKKYPRIDKIEMLANYFGVLKSDLIEEPVDNLAPSEPQLTGVDKELFDALKRMPKEKKLWLLEMIQGSNNHSKD